VRALLALSLVMLGGGERWTPRHEPEAAYRREFTRIANVQVTDAYVRANGEEKHVESPGVSSEESNRVVVTERALSVQDGALLVLERRYDELARSLRGTQPGKDGKPQQRDRADTGALEGRTVRFERAKPAEDFEARLVDKDGPREELPRLEADMGAWGILPESAPAIGGSWKIGAERFRAALLRPGGRPRWPLLAGAPPAEERLTEGLWDAMRGELELRYVERVEREGRSYARIELKGSIELAAETRRGEGENGAARYRREGQGELAGTLEWSLGEGCTSAFELEMKLRMSATEWGELKTKDGESLEVERELESDVVEKLTYKAERVAG